MRLREGLDPEDMLDRGECHLLEDLGRPNSLEMEEVLRAEVLGDTVAPLELHVLAFLVHELVGPPLLARLHFVRPIGEELAPDDVRLEVGRADRAVLADADEVAATFIVGPKRPLIREVQLGDGSALVRVYQHCGEDVLELLLLEHRYHEDSPIVRADDRRGGVFVLEDDSGSHFLVGEEEAELARVVEGFEHL